MLFPTIDPVAFTVLGWPVYWYGMMYLVGIWLGWCWARRSCVRFPGLLRQDIDDFVPWLVIGVIVGGRLGYVLFYDIAYFWAHPVDVFKTWQGGMSFHGGVVGVVLACVIYTTRRRIPLSSFMDNLALCVPVGIFFGRLGNLINQEVYGRITEVSWAIVFPAVDFFPRHPSQIYEALLEGVFLFVLLNTAVWSWARKPWALSGLFLVGYGTARWVCELYRVPDDVFVLGSFVVTQGQLLSLPMIAGGIFLLWRCLRKA